MRSAKKFSIVLIFFMVTAILLTFFTPAVSNAAELVIVLDPGHGGGDPGAINTVDGINYEEKVLNLKIAQATKAYLEQFEGVKVCMTRENNETELTLAQRVSLANKKGAHVLVSIHNNSSSSSSARGTLVLVANSDYRPEITTATKKLGQNILSRLTQTGLEDRGLVAQLATSGSYVVYYPDGSPQDYYGIIQRSIRAGFPGIIIETAFISNPDDVRDFLSTDEKIENLGTAVGKGIADYYGLSADTVYDTPARTPIDGKNLSFNDKAEAEPIFALGDTVKTTENGCVTLSSKSSAPAALIDYMGMSLNAKENMCAVIRAKSSYKDALLSIFCGSDLIVTADEYYCLAERMQEDYQYYLLDFSKLPGWDMGVNLLQINVKGAETITIDSIEFFSDKSAVPYSKLVTLSTTDTDTSVNVTPSPAPTTAPTVAPTAVPTPTATPTTAPTAVPSPATATPEDQETTLATEAPASPDNTVLLTEAPKATAPAANTNSGSSNNDSAADKSNTKIVVVSVIAVILVVAIAIFLTYTALKARQQ